MTHRCVDHVTVFAVQLAIHNVCLAISVHRLFPGAQKASFAETLVERWACIEGLAIVGSDPAESSPQYVQSSRGMLRFRRIMLRYVRRNACWRSDRCVEHSGR